MNQKERDEILLDLKAKTDKHDELLLAINFKLKEHDEQFKSINGEMADRKEEIASISGSVAKIEVERGGNIQLLLDGQVGILNKLDSFEKRFESDEKDLEGHSNRIWNLESRVGII